MEKFEKLTKDTVLFRRNAENNDKLTILFGWSGSLHRHLDKYSKIYQDSGYHTVQVTQTTPFQVSVDLKDYDNILNELIPCLDDEFHLKTRKNFNITFHVLSNGGFVRFMKCMRIFSTQKYIHWSKFLSLIVCDSCPGISRPLAAAKISKEEFSGQLAQNTVYYGMLSYRFFKNLIRNEYESWIKEIGLFQCLRKDLPILIIYSSADDLIWYRDVEDFGKIWRNFQSNLQMVNFVDSPHVEHFQKHKEKYIELIRSRL